MGESGGSRRRARMRRAMSATGAADRPAMAMPQRWRPGHGPVEPPRHPCAGGSPSGPCCAARSIGRLARAGHACQGVVHPFVPAGTHGGRQDFAPVPFERAPWQAGPARPPGPGAAASH